MSSYVLDGKNSDSLPIRITFKLTSQQLNTQEVKTKTLFDSQGIK